MKIKALTPRIGDIRIQDIATFDIESTNWTNFVIGGVYDGETYQDFTSLKKCLSYMLSPKFHGKNIYAHFGGKYDFLFLLEHLHKMGYKSRLVEINGSIIQIQVNLGNRKVIRFRDSFALLPAKLDKLSKDFDVETKKGKINYDEIGVNERTKEYLKSDCIALYQVIIAAQKMFRFNGGEMKLTVASTAMDAFCRSYLKRDIYCNSVEIDNYARYGYYGGRVENIVRQASNINAYDITSAYPYVMKNEVYPVGIASYYKSIGDAWKREGGLAEIQVEIDQSIKYPLLPVRHYGKLIFPCGKIQGIYPFPFLKRLDEMGIKFRILNAIIYPEMIDLFSEYVDKNFSAKELAKSTGQKSKEFIAKLLLNSLYGKFAQKVLRTNYIINPSKNDFKNLHLEIVSEKIDLWKFEEEMKANYIHPQIAAYVTAYAQINLHRLIELSNAVYYDTDSIFTSEELPTWNGLGGLKLEKRLNKCIFLAPKLYAAIDENGREYIRAKGFSQSDLSFIDFENFINGNGEIKTENKRGIMGFKSALKKGGIVLRKEIKKSFLDKTGKREFISDYESKPLTLNLF